MTESCGEDCTRDSLHILETTLDITKKYASQGWQPLIKLQPTPGKTWWLPPHLEHPLSEGDWD